MGKRGGRKRQPSMWVTSSELPRSAGNPFYERLNRVLDEAGFDAFVEEQCAKFYADGVGRPSLAPGRYFRMLLLGYHRPPAAGTHLPRSSSAYRRDRGREPQRRQPRPSAPEDLGRSPRPWPEP